MSIVAAAPRAPPIACWSCIARRRAARAWGATVAQQQQGITPVPPPRFHSYNTVLATRTWTPAPFAACRYVLLSFLSRAATILWARLVTFGRFVIGLLASLTNAGTVCGLPLCGAANPGSSRPLCGSPRLCARWSAEKTLTRCDTPRLDVDEQISRRHRWAAFASAPQTAAFITIRSLGRW